MWQPMCHLMETILISNLNGFFFPHIAYCIFQINSSLGPFLLGFSLLETSTVLLPNGLTALVCCTAVVLWLLFTALLDTAAVAGIHHLLCSGLFPCFYRKVLIEIKFWLKYWLRVPRKPAKTCLSSHMIDSLAGYRILGEKKSLSELSFSNINIANGSHVSLITVV